MEIKQFVESYKQKWENEFMNKSSFQLEAMWKDLFESLEKVKSKNAIRRRKIKDVPLEMTIQETLVYSCPMGSGKTTSLIHYLQYNETLKYYKVLIIVELIDTANYYESQLNEYKKCYALHSKKNYCILEDIVNDNSIVVITHERYKKLLRNGLADEIFEQFDLIVIDEEVTSYEVISISYFELKSEILSVLESLYLPEDKYLCFKEILEKMNELTINNDLFSSSDTLVDKICNSKINQFYNFNDLYEILKEKSSITDKKLSIQTENLIKKLQILNKIGRTKVSYYHKSSGNITFNVVIDYFPDNVSKIILDGTASINEMYKLLNKSLNNEIKIFDYSHIRNYSNAKLHTYLMNTGKNTLTESGEISKETIIDRFIILIQEVKKRYSYSDDNKILFIVHKDNVPLIEPLLEENMDVLNWGKHIGTNDYKDYNKLVIYGLNHLPSNLYRAKYFSCTTNNNIDKETISNLEASTLAIDILQAMNRISIRKPIDEIGNCSNDIEVLLTLPKSNRQLVEKIYTNILKVMPNINLIKDTNDLPFSKLKISISKNTRKLLDFLNLKCKDSRLQIKKFKGQVINYIVPTKEIYSNDYGVFSKQQFRTLINSKNITNTNLVLMENSWQYCKLKNGEAKELGLNGDTKQIFYRINDFFIDETEYLNSDF